MQFEMHRRERGEVPVGALLMLPLFALPFGAWLVQTGWVVFGTCGVKMAVGLPCFTCGATRATIALLGGDVIGAVALQPLVILAYTLLAGWGLISLASFLADRSVSVSLSKTENTILKVLLVTLPFLNWAYLIAAGI